MSHRAERSRALRYKRPALTCMGYEAVIAELDGIREACSDVHWFSEQDEETLLNAMDGEEDEAWEFRLMFADLEARAEQLYEALTEWGVAEDYDTCTVALIGNRYRTVGYDGYEEDYTSLCHYEQELAHTEAGKRLMRRNKAEIIATIGQCVGALVSFLDLRQQYDYLKATFDILRGENTSVLRLVKDIDAAYNEAESGGDSRKLDRLLLELPDRLWIE